MDFMNDLINNIARLHTTSMGLERIRHNLSLNDTDIVKWCRLRISNPDSHIERRGKNWYVTADDCIITVNATSYTIITAHKI